MHRPKNHNTRARRRDTSGVLPADRDMPVAKPHGLAREISKRGICSRSNAASAVRAGRVRLDGRIVSDPERACTSNSRIELDGAAVEVSHRIYVMLNKPRGLVTTAQDEQGRATVYAAMAGAGLPWLAPVGRLDRASEGLLLLSNDSIWSAALTDPACHVVKTYRLQVRGVPDDAALERMREGVIDRGEHLAVRSATRLQSGGRTTWIECALEEGRNRHLRRLLAALGFEVLRLMRVAIGPIALGDLARGAWRMLEAGEVEALSTAAGLQPAQAAQRHDQQQSEDRQ